MGMSGYNRLHYCLFLNLCTRDHKYETLMALYLGEMSMVTHPLCSDPRLCSAVEQDSVGKNVNLRLNLLLGPVEKVFVTFDEYTQFKSSVIHSFISHIHTTCLYQCMGVFKSFSYSLCQVS